MRLVDLHIHCPNELVVNFSLVEGYKCRALSKDKFSLVLWVIENGLLTTTPQ